MPRIYSISEISALLNVPEHRIQYAHRSRKLDEPYCMFTGRRAYDCSDIIEVAEHFGVDVPERILEQQQEERERAARLEWAEKNGVFTKEGRAKTYEMGKKLGLVTPYDNEFKSKDN